MFDGEQSSSSVLASMRRTFETLLSTIQNRIELFAVDLQEEKCWLIATLIWTAASVFFGILAVVAVSITIVWVCPENARPYVLSGLSVVFLVLACVAIFCLRKLLKDKPPPLSNTLSELKKDIHWTQSPD
jgi:uncharacterized membrane protein YqjE